MAPAPGTHKLSSDSGTMQVRTHREGMAQKIGHDLIIEVGRWNATVEIGADGTPSAVGLDADARSLEVREGLHGVKPLTDKDRAEIAKNIDEKILRRQPIVFRSRSVNHSGGKLSVEGELTIAGNSRSASFELELAADGRVTGTLPVTQSEWGIKPYRAFMGALKVKDTVEVVVEAQLPPD